MARIKYQLQADPWGAGGGDNKGNEGNYNTHECDFKPRRRAI
jgi:hypothetical protein